MNLQNVKQKLEKVNRFYDYLDANKDIISRVDRDALIASIRDLYDACFEEGASSVTKEASPEVHKTTNPVVQSKTTETTKKKPKLVFNTNTETTVEKQTTTKVEQQKPVVEPVKETPAKEKLVAKKETPKENTTPKAAENATNSDAANDTFNEDFEELFVFKEATDLSQKLSATPLNDLNKALGLNEKFLYINELFGGDVAKFQAAIKRLNDEKDFDTARLYLESDLIETHTWMKKAKKSIAKDFVKLVRRRYL